MLCGLPLQLSRTAGVSPPDQHRLASSPGSAPDSEHSSAADAARSRPREHTSAGCCPDVAQGVSVPAHQPRRAVSLDRLTACTSLH